MKRCILQTIYEEFLKKLIQICIYPKLGKRGISFIRNSLIQPKNSCYRRDWILIKSMVTCLNHQLMLRQCQMTYEKIEQKKKAQMNLENCRSFRLWQPTATLDGTKKNCCRLITDGEALKNSQSFSVDYSSIAVLFRAIKGTPLCGGWDNYLWL